MKIAVLVLMWVGFILLFIGVWMLNAANAAKENPSSFPLRNTYRHALAQQAERKTAWVILFPGLPLALYSLYILQA